MGLLRLLVCPFADLLLFRLPAFSTMSKIPWVSKIQWLGASISFLGRGAGAKIFWCSLPRDVRTLFFFPMNGFSVLNHQKLFAFSRASQISQPSLRALRTVLAKSALCSACEKADRWQTALEILCDMPAQAVLGRASRFGAPNLTPLRRFLFFVLRFFFRPGIFVLAATL